MTQQTKRSDTQLDFGHLPTLVGFQLRQAQGRMFTDFLSAMAEESLTPGQYGLLVLIAANNGPSQSALARALGVERSTMVVAIDKLEKRNLVRREASPEDLRANALVLTEEGGRLMARLAPKIAAHENRITKRLNDAERAELMRLLNKLGV